MSKLLDDDDFDSLFEDLEIETGTEDDPEKKGKTPDTEPEFLIPDDEDDFLSNIGGDEDDEEDEEEGDEPTPDSDDAEEEDDDDEDSSKYFEAVAKGLLKLGKFGEVPEDFKWSQEAFIEKFEEWSEQNSRAKIDEILTEKWGELGIEMFDDIFVKKVNVKEYLSAYAEAEDFSKVDLEKESNQKVVIKAYLERMGVDEDEIFDQIELLEEKGKLKERSEKYKSKLIEDNLAAMQEMSAKREAQIKAHKDAEAARLTAISTALKEAVQKKEINGIPLSAKDDKELLKFVTAPAYKLRSGEEITELDKKILEIKKDPIKWLALGKLVKEDLNVGPIKRKAKDEGGEDIFNFVKGGKSPKPKDVVSELDKLFKRKR